MLQQSQEFGDSQSSWGDCPAGALTDLGDALRTRQRNRQRRFAMYSATIGAIVTMIMFGLFSPREPDMHPACQKVSPLLAAYHRHELSDAERAEVEAHLKVCPHCRGIYEQLRFRPQHEVGVDSPTTTALANTQSRSHHFRGS